MQFHWKSLITYSGFWSVKILLLKFDTSSKKQMIIIKKFWWKKKKKKKDARKVYINIKKHSLQWTRPTDPWCNMLETLEMQRKYRWLEIVSGTHSLKLMSHGILHYLWSADQYIFNRFCPVEECGVTQHSLYSDSLVLRNWFSRISWFLGKFAKICLGEISLFLYLRN